MPSTEAHGRQLYLDLLKKNLVNLIYLDLEVRIDLVINAVKSGGKLDLATLKDVRQSYQPLYDQYATHRVEGKQLNTRWWGLYPHTMISLARLKNIEDCVCSVIQQGVSGDLVETGVWRGGAAIMMRGVLEAFSETQRRVWVCDSFEGLPKPEAPQDQGMVFHTMDFLSINVQTVKRNFEAYGLLDDQVKFLKGWFSDTLPKAPIEKIAVLRVDGDLYKSTMDVLDPLYDKVSVGGYVIIDDYHELEPCRAAVDDFRHKHGIAEPLIDVDWTAVYWKKER